MEEWYASPAVEVGDGDYFRVVGTAPELPYIFRSDVVGEHARWQLEMRRKYDARWPWWDFREPKWMRLSIPRFYRLSPADRLLGAAMAAWLVVMVALRRL